jgi:hypothetical protein
MHIESGETQEGSGFRREGYKGPMGDKRELVYEQPGIEVDDSCHSWREPSTVSRREYSKGNTARGNVPCAVVYCNSCSCTY